VDVASLVYAVRAHARRAAKPPDGRVLRGARNHALIVQALYALLREGNVQPTAEEVAKRAGVGTRTVFRQFEDMESLYSSLGDRLQAEIMALIDLTPPEGDLAKDVRVLVARRARIFEHLTPFRRAGRLVRHTSAYLQDQDATITAIFREAMAAILGPHLSDDAADTFEALDVLLSFEAWDRLRDQQRLSAKRAEQVLVKAATALLKSARASRS
jgi:AcrR family transcriptional regulator